jgi:hypothetical protein
MKPDRPAFRAWPAALLALLALGLGAACARLSVSHLETRPLAAGSNGTVTMRYFSFTYATAFEDGAYNLRGLARPVPAALPGWADRLESLTIAAYVSDAAGHVVAQGEKTYPGLALGPDAAEPFAFRLLPGGAAPPGGLSVSFGYKAVFGSSAARQTLPGMAPPPGSVFFAGEGALLMH